MPRKLEECDILFAHGVENADGAVRSAGEADDGAARAAKLALQRLHLFGRRMEMLLEKPLKNVHGGLSGIARSVPKQYPEGERSDAVSLSVSRRES